MTNKYYITLHYITLHYITLHYVDSQSDEEYLKHHLESLAPFFNRITTRGQYDSTLNDDDVEEAHRYQEISIPETELPPGFRLEYVRRVTRAEYRFAEQNILRTSKEKVFKQEDKYFNSNQSDVIDLFFENKVIDDILKGEDWQPAQVVDEMKKLLKFSNTMLKDCLKK